MHIADDMMIMITVALLQAELHHEDLVNALVTKEQADIAFVQESMFALCTTAERLFVEGKRCCQLQQLTFKRLTICFPVSAEYFTQKFKVFWRPLPHQTLCLQLVWEADGDEASS